MKGTIESNTDGFKYWAFISYSHTDTKWAEWLQRSLETYRVPRKLVGKEGRDGSVPKRVFPIFRDRDELPTSSDLGEQLKNALSRSRFLVVICSPASARSRWVNEEVRLFKALGKENRILCLIVAGEPNADLKSANREEECFTEALRYKLAPDGQLSTTRVEPIAADARRAGDTKQEIRLKFTAGLIGVDYDALRRRDLRRRRKRRLASALFVLGITAFLVSTWRWQQHLIAERTKAARIAHDFEQGRQEVLKGNLLRALPFLSDAYTLGDSRPALRFLLHRAMTEIDAQLLSITDKDSRICTYNRLGSARSIGGAVLSKGGTRFVTTHESRELKLWNIEPVQLLRRIGPLNLIAVSRDAQRVLAAERNGFSIWDVGRGQKVFHPSQDIRDVPTGCISADARLVALATNGDNSVRIFDAETGMVLNVLRGHTNTITSLTFNSDASRIVTASNDETAKVWAVPSGKLIASLIGSGLALDEALFSPDGKRVVTFTIGTIKTAKQVAAWDTETGKLIGYLDGVDSPFHAVLFGQKDEDITAFIPSGGGVDSIGLVHRKTVASLREAASDIQWIEIAPNERRILTSGGDRRITIWDTATWTPELVLEAPRTAAGFTDNLGLAHFSGDEQRIITLSWAGEVSIWSTDTAREIDSYSSPQGVPPVIQSSEDGKRMLLVWPTRVELWDTQTARLVWERDFEERVIKRTTLERHGNRVAIEIDGDRVTLWDADRNERIVSIRGNTPQFDNQGRLLINNLEGGATLLSASDGKSLKVIGDSAKYRNNALSADGTRFLSVDENSVGKLWDTSAGRLLAAGIGGIFSPSGKLIAGFHGNKVYLRNSSDGKMQKILSVTGYGIANVDFSPNERQIVTTGLDGLVRMWNIETGQLIRTFEAGSNFSVANFSPDGALLITVGSDSLSSIWETANGALLTRLYGYVQFLGTSERVVNIRGRSHVVLYDARYETRSSNEIAILVRDKDPWQLQSSQVVLGHVAR